MPPGSIMPIHIDPIRHPLTEATWWARRALVARPCSRRATGRLGRPSQAQLALARVDHARAVLCEASRKAWANVPPASAGCWQVVGPR